MPSAMLPDALADALGRVVADVQRQARKDVELIAAECRVMVANLKLEIAAFKEEVHRLHAEDRQRLGVALAAVKDGEPGKDGRDGIDGQDGAAGRDGVNGLDGKDGRDGIDGKDGAAARDGVDGFPGKDGAPGLPGERGLPGQDGLEGKPGRDGRDGLPGLNGKDGEPGRAGLDGQDGRDGKDGLGFEHLEERIEDGGRILIRTYRRGEEVNEFRHVTAMPVYRGVWKEGQYQRGDTVTRDGSQWHCETETAATPGLSPDWRLCVKHGRAGKDGERGPPGPKGDPGRDLTQLGPDGRKW
jgi:hypothetical protein